MPAIFSSPQSTFVGRRCCGNRLCFRLAILSLILLNMTGIEPVHASGAKETAEAVPFNIHPLCLGNLIGAMDSSRPDEVEVKANTLTECEDATIEVEAREKGAFAYNSSDTRLEGYTAYTFMGDLSDGRGSVFRYEYSGGGTGRFTSLWLLEGEPSGGENKLRISFLEGAGDRCNGSISNAEVIGGLTGDDLVVERLITPSDVISLGKNLPPALASLQPYDDLTACAICCAGSVTTRRPILGNDAESIVGFEISKTNFVTGGVNDQGRFQACFNDVLDELSDGAEWLKLDVEEADRFRTAFAERCLGS